MRLSFSSMSEAEGYRWNVKITIMGDEENLNSKLLLEFTNEVQHDGQKETQSQRVVKGREVKAD